MRALLGTVIALLLAALLATFLLATPAGARALAATLRWAGGSAPTDDLRDAQAIVLLGGRTARVHFAAQLHRQAQLPLLVSGKGTGDHPFAAESEKMAQILRDQYGIAVRWLEKESLDTEQNAAYSWCVAGRQGIRRVVLVTDADHMLRARATFHAAGFGPILPAPAPMPPQPALPPLTPEDFRPDLRRIQPGSAHALLEFGGAALMLWKGWTGSVAACPLQPADADAAASRSSQPRNSCIAPDTGRDCSRVSQ